MRLLSLLALLLPARDRERFVGEVLGNMAELQWRQRAHALLSVACAVPVAGGDPAVRAAAAGLMRQLTYQLRVRTSS